MYHYICLGLVSFTLVMMLWYQYILYKATRPVCKNCWDKDAARRKKYCAECEQEIKEEHVDIGG